MIENCHFPSHCANFYSMGEKSWLRRRIKDGLHRGFQHAYETVKVDPARFLLQLRAAYGLPITNLQGVYSVEISRLDDLATRFIRDRKSTRLNSSHTVISYAVFCLKKK